MVLTAMFTALITAGAYIRIPVPICPFTLQFLFTTLAGIILGKNKGAAATALYVILGLANAEQAASGFNATAQKISVSAGKLSQKFGSLAEKTKGLSMAAGGALVGLAGLAVVYALGMLYYYMISAVYLRDPIGIGALFLYCFVLAVPGDIALCLLSTALAKRLMPVIYAKGII